MSSRSPVTDKAARTAPPLPMKRRGISRRKSEDRDGGLHHAAEVDAFLGERLGFLGGRCRLRLEVGTLSRRRMVRMFWPSVRVMRATQRLGPCSTCSIWYCLYVIMTHG